MRNHQLVRRTVATTSRPKPSVCFRCPVKARRQRGAPDLDHANVVGARAFVAHAQHLPPRLFPGVCNTGCAIGATCAAFEAANVNVLRF